MVVKTVVDNDPGQLVAAFDYLAQGVKEKKGTAAHPVITASYKAAGFSIQDDVTAWCGGFMSLCCRDAGLPIPLVNPLGGINWESWGTGVFNKKRGEGAIELAQRGDVLTLFYEGEDSWKRHVCQFLGFEGNKVVVIGGNQQNSVSVGAYPIANISTIRRAVPATKKDLLDAGSTEMATAQNIARTGVVSTVGTGVTMGVQGYVDPTVAPPPPPPAAALDLPKTAEQVGAVQVIADGLGGIWGFISAHPVLFLTLMLSLGLWYWGVRLGNSRLLRHILGYPISKEVASQEPSAEALAQAG